MDYKKCYYVTDAGEVKNIYAHITKFERLKLRERLESKKIKYNGNHYLFYGYLLENHTLPIFEKANETIAEETGLSESTIKTLKKQFIKIGILKILKFRSYDTTILKVIPIISGFRESEFDYQKEGGQNLPTEGIKIQPASPVLGIQNLTTNINNISISINDDLPEPLKQLIDKWEVKRE